jgi:signal transduction histidine kinase
LNTLTAIAQGVGAEPQLAVLRRTCADDAALLRSLAGAADMTAVVDLQDVIEWLQASGVEVELDLNHLGALPSDVRTAFTTGIREALTNAHRHASATAVRAVARRESGSVVVVVEDDGRGISPDATNRFGVEHSMRRAMTDIGGRTSIDSNPGRGTIVEFSWTPDVLGSQGPNVRGGAVAFAGPFLAAALILALVAVFTSPGARMWGAAAGALVAALVVGLAFDVRQGRIGWQWTVATCAAVPLILSLHSPSSPGGPESSVDWATRAAAALVIVVVATGPWWAWIPAVGTWLVAFEDRLAAPLLPTVFLILGSSLIARSVRASRGRERALLDRLARSRAEEQGEGEAARRIAERYRVLSASRAGELLAAVADGSADPGDVEFRSRCAAEELFIRSAMRLDPGGDPFHALVGQLLVTARRAGIRLEVDLADTPEPGGLDSPPLRRTLTALVRSLDGTGRLSCRLEHDAYVLRLVGPSLPRLPAVELGTLTEMSEAGIMLWELRQPAE